MGSFKKNIMKSLAFMVENVQLAWRDITKGGKKASEEAGETTAASAFQLKNKMKLAEARQVLDVEEDATLSQIRKNFKHLYKASAPDAGNSFYLQSKVFRARETLYEEMERIANSPDPDAVDTKEKTEAEGEGKPEEPEDKPKA